MVKIRSGRSTPLEWKLSSTSSLNLIRSSPRRPKAGDSIESDGAVVPVYVSSRAALTWADLWLAAMGLGFCVVILTGVGPAGTQPFVAGLKQNDPR
jgi:hypothetical protein